MGKSNHTYVEVIGSLAIYNGRRVKVEVTRNVDLVEGMVSDGRRAWCMARARSRAAAARRVRRTRRMRRMWRVRHLKAKLQVDGISESSKGSYNTNAKDSILNKAGKILNLNYLFIDLLHRIEWI